MYIRSTRLNYLNRPRRICRSSDPGSRESARSFLSHAAETDRQLIEIERRHIENERHHVEIERRRADTERAIFERFGRVEQDIANIVRILGEHGRIIERLTDAVREKIGSRVRNEFGLFA